MLDNLSFDPAIAGVSTDWRQSLTWGDIVNFRFPAEGVGPLARARPCLVLDTARFGESRYAVLAYGTGVGTAAPGGNDITLTAAEARAAGLDGPARFLAERRRLVALDDPGLVPGAATRTPVIGRLTGHAYERMEVMRACLHAGTDAAAGRRPARRSPRPGRHRRSEPRPVTLEYRYPRRRRRAPRA